MNRERYDLLDRIMKSGAYYVDTDTGRVWSNKNEGQWLKPRIDSDGYEFVTLCFEHQKPLYKVHQIVAYSVFGEDLIGLTVNHKNGCKTDNGIHNLELATVAQQNKHALETGLRRIYGEGNWRSKLTAKQVIEIRELYDTGKYSQEKLGRIYGVSQKNIGNIVRRKNWVHVTGKETKGATV